jgi:hypothetical protein
MRALGQVAWPGAVVAGLAIALFLAADYARLRYRAKHVWFRLLGAASVTTLISAVLMVIHFAVLRS